MWVGAVTTLAGGLLGGAISFLLSRQQALESRRQRAADDVREQRRRSEERRYAAYADFLTRARAFRNAAVSYCARFRKGAGPGTVDAPLEQARDAAALVFLVAESREAHEGCRSVLRALSRSRALLDDVTAATAAARGQELSELLGQALREFQNAARAELGVAGPAVPWEAGAAERAPVSAIKAHLPAGD